MSSSSYVTSTASPPSPATQLSPWHSPIPYLFGGLAAMLGLIAFALLILACSYWKLSGSFEDRERDLESEGDGEKKCSPAPTFVLEEQVLVIMAGQPHATCLGTVVSGQTLAFGSKSLCTSTSTSPCSEEGNSSGRIDPMVSNVEVHEADQVQ